MVWEGEEILWNSNFQWIHNLIFSYLKYAVFFSTTWCTTQGKLQKWDTVHHAVSADISFFYFLKGTNVPRLTGQRIIRFSWSSIKLYVIKTFWPLYVIRHSRHRTAFSNCTAALQHLKPKEEIHLRATSKFFTVLISILKNVGNEPE